jgi:putative ABC transport system permease protein
MSVLTLALGIGATTALFSLVSAVLLEPLPYADADRLVRVWEVSPEGGQRNVVSPGNVTDWQQRARSFDVLGAHTFPSELTLTGDGEVTRVRVVTLEPEVLTALRVVPVLGRTLIEEDTRTGGVVLISHGLWESRYGSDPEIIGRRVVLDDVTYAVVGVAPPGFELPEERADFWRPYTPQSFDPNERTSHSHRVIARLAAGAAIESAQAEMSRISQDLAIEHPAEMTGWGARVVPLHDDLTRDVDTLFWILLGGVVVVLLITCTNIANLLLARAVGREREIALRGALGASRGRILRQLCTEGALLTLVGGVLAASLAPVLLRALVGAAPANIPLLERATIDGRMLAFTGLAALSCALLFGLAPAIRLARHDVEASLRRGFDAARGGHVRLRSALLVVQVGLTVVLLVGAGLFVRSFQAVQRTELAFDPERLVRLQVSLPLARYPQSPEQIAFYDALLARIATIPGVVDVAGTTQPPGTRSLSTFSFAIEGRMAADPSGREDDETLHAVTSGYFEAVGHRMVTGRAFHSRDRSDAPPVVIFNESLARKHFPEGDVLGHRISFRPGETPWMEIVGVVEDARLESPDVDTRPGIFIPYEQKSWWWMAALTVVARAAEGTDPLELSAALRSALLELDPNLPPIRIDTVEEAFRAGMARRTFASTLVGGFGLLALVLSVVGLYGLISYSVSRERRTIGVRMALGAHRRDVVARVVTRAVGLAAAGAALGLTVAVGTSRALEGLLYGVSPVDGITYAAISILVLLVAVATAALPALRAARMDPIQAIRTE